ncbi:MAG TPA: FtsX-like permease family protein, partial [Caulobacteraceae bacterium]|nr:FtsX-like permease family protein [Caulobacteraceae bacterium]
MFRNYLAASLRNLARNGQYAGITIAGLAIAFAASILIGLYVRDELSYDSWIPGHERVFMLRQKITGALSKPLIEDQTPGGLADLLKLDFPEIQSVARFRNSGYPPAIRRGDISIAERGFIWADPDFFKIVLVPTVAGDPAKALEAPDHLVLTRGAARKYFGRDAPIGGVLQVDGVPMSVAAVVEDWPDNSNVTGEVFGSSLAPQSMTQSIVKAGFLSNTLETFVKLKPGVQPAAINGRLPGMIGRQIMPSVNTFAPNEHLRIQMWLEPITSIHLDPVASSFAPETDPTVVVAIGVIGALIIVVAAINFVTLMTARAARRAVEVGVRKALGASRRDLVVQFMGEALVYVAVALVVAVAIAEIALPGLNTVLQRSMAFDYLSDPALLLSLLGVAAVVGLLAGVYPAVILSAFRPAAVLKGGPIANSGGGGLRQALVVVQFCVLIVVVLAAATIARQTAFAVKEGTRINMDAVVLLFASPCTDTLRDAVKAIPGVKSAACSSPGALALANSIDNVVANGRRTNLTYASVDFGFFELYGVRPLAGRTFAIDHPADDGANHADDAPPIVINQAAARALGFATPQAAVGHLANWHFRPNWRLDGSAISAPVPYRSSQILGVVPDFNFGSVRTTVEPSFYYVAKKVDFLSSVALNIRLDPARVTETLPRVERVWKEVSHGQPLQEVFANQLMLRLYIDTIIECAFIAVCGLIAVSVACLGLFALSAYTAERRTKEIGVRKAMGASSSDILKLLLWQFLWPVLAANLIAWPIAFLVMNWWLQGFAYRIDQSPWTFLAAGAAALVIALATVFV